MSSSDRILTVSDVIALSIIVDLAAAKERIKWTPDKGETTHVGTARHLCDENYGLFRGDVRDAYLRVTHLNGVESLLRVTDCMGWLDQGALARDLG